MKLDHLIEDQIEIRTNGEKDLALKLIGLCRERDILISGGIKQLYEYDYLFIYKDCLLGWDRDTNFKKISITEIDDLKESEMYEMKKSDLIIGKHVVELRSGVKYLWMGNGLITDNGNPYMHIANIDEDLRSEGYVAFDDIMKVFEIEGDSNVIKSLKKQFDSAKLIWERDIDIELTMNEVMRIISDTKGVDIDKIRIKSDI